MTKSTITREQLLEIIETDHVQCGEASYLARMALAAMASEHKRNPVLAYADSYRDMANQGVESVPIWSVITDLERNIAPLYRHAQPAPVVPKNCVTAEHRRVIEMLLNVCGAAFELADDSCQQDVDGEDCHVVPDDAFQKLSDALDEIENTLPTEDIDRPDVFLAWSAMPRAALKSILHAQPAPVVPEDIPDCVYEILCQACGGNAWMYSDALWNACRAAMLAAAPQSPGSEPATAPGKWISVSERMPEVGDIVLTAMGGAVNVGEMECSAANCLFFTSVISGRELPATHWMPLPAGPKEDINALIPLVSRNEQEGK